MVLLLAVDVLVVAIVLEAVDDVRDVAVDRVVHVRVLVLEVSVFVEEVDVVRVTLVLVVWT
jgi:hypothetical protein